MVRVPHRPGSLVAENLRNRVIVDTTLSRAHLTRCARRHRYFAGIRPDGNLLEFHPHRRRPP